MPSGNISLGMIIGATVGSSFARAMSSATSTVNKFKRNADEARGFRAIISDTIRLRKELSKTLDTGSNAFKKLQKNHDSNLALLKKHGFAVDQLGKEYAKLGKTIKSMELLAAGRAQIGEGWQQLKGAGRVGGAIVGAATMPTMAAANYQAIIRDIAIKGGIARTGSEADLSRSIRVDADAAGIDRKELAKAVNTLVAGGMEVAEAAQMAGLMARFSVGQNADSGDVAKLVLALRQAGISDPAIMERALGKVAVAGDLGSFEAKDMARHFAALMPQLTAFGMAGEHATIALANMLQTQMKAAGNADEAANNLANLLAKITSEDSKRKFEKSGIDLEGSMQAALAKGFDPITAFLRLIQESSARIDPDKAKELAALQERIATTEDPAAAQRMLDGYLAMAGLSEYITDRQAKQAALAALQNQQLHKENLQRIKDTDGQAKIEKDLADRRAASQNKWREVGQSFDDAMVAIGDAIRPITDVVAEMLSKLGSALASLATAAPVATQVILGAAAGFSLFKGAQAGIKIAGGIGQMMRGWAIGRKGVKAGAERGLGHSMGTALRKGKGKLSGKRGIVGAAMDVITGGSADVQRVFVVNMPSDLGLPDLPGKKGKGGSFKGKLKGGWNAVKAGSAGVFGRIAPTLVKASPYAVKAGGALAAVGAAYKAVDTYSSAQTGKEKAEGYGGAAGGLAGGLAGAKLGAVAGAMAGPVGVAIGGVLGGIIGGVAGDALGGWIGKTFLASEKTSDKKPVVPAPEPAPQPKAATPPTQKLEFAPELHITVQGDVKDPRTLARELMPHLHRMFDQFRAQGARGVLYDLE